MPLTLQVPDEIREAMRLPEAEREPRILIELACALYQREILTFGKAAQLARLSQERFGHELTARSIPRHYSETDVSEDLAYAGGE